MDFGEYTYWVEQIQQARTEAVLAAEARCAVDCDAHLRALVHPNTDYWSKWAPVLEGERLLDRNALRLARLDAELDEITLHYQAELDNLEEPDYAESDNR